jgi:hypothetical protein
LACCCRFSCENAVAIHIPLMIEVASLNERLKKWLKAIHGFPA